MRSTGKFRIAAGYAVRENLKECASRFSLRHRCTWRHPRFQSEHELDHAFILESCLWHLTKCRILKEGLSVQGPWVALHRP